MIYNLALIISIIFFIFIIILNRKNKIDKIYSVIWMILSIAIIFITIFPEFITKLTQKFGIYYKHTILVFIAIAILVIWCIYSSIKISKQNNMIIKLTQELALMKINQKNNTNKK